DLLIRLSAVPLATPSHRRSSCRLEKPSFDRALPTWNFTASRLTPMRSAMRRLVIPCRTCSATFHSAGVSTSSCGGRPGPLVIKASPSGRRPELPYPLGRSPLRLGEDARSQPRADPPRQRQVALDDQLAREHRVAIGAVADPHLAHRLCRRDEEDVDVAPRLGDAHVDLAVADQQPPVALLGNVVETELDHRLLAGK